MAEAPVSNLKVLRLFNTLIILLMAANARPGQVKGKTVALRSIFALNYLTL